MSRARHLILAAALTATPLTTLAATSADATPQARSRYTSCPKLHRDYPNGVGKRGAVDKSNGRPKANPVRNFKVDNRLYASLPKTLDADKDGIACERHTPGTTTRSAPAPAPARPAAGSTTLPAPGGFGFVTPSGNIMCFASDDDVRCDVTERTYRVPPRPAWCDTDWGHSIGLRRTAALECAGDTLAGSAPVSSNSWFRRTGARPLTTFGAPQAVLPYRWTVHSDRIFCTSTTAGVTCTNSTTRHGFTLAKASYRLF